ncbi:Gfo/Idh/MocA family protein [Natronorubrum halophilum]|uniref:Gfo/Idh/MocA family protein n=1 Tax=Natronorubrum halophilum TaxID=1702106 RepID=UPI000EF6C786|nr:Gfo/Idh/MocA family oxidoreductase [Natronorubrum halophilum]
MVRIGLIGSGFMSQMHVDAYAEIDDATVAAVASPNTADEFVERAGLEATTYRSAETMMDEANVDAIDVCSPTPTHRPMVEAAVERGLDVFCEKPIAGSLADARAITDVVAEADVMFMVGHVLRFFPQYARIRDLVRDGGIGDPGVARARRLSEFPAWGHENWYADRDSSGGVLLDLAIHDFDYLRWVVGDIDRVFARRTTWDRGEQAHATVRFADGAVGYVEASWGLPPDHGLEHSFELAGDDGLVEFDGDEPAVTTRTAAGTDAESPLAADGYQRQLEAFLESRRTGDSPPVTAEDAVEALRVSLAALRSAAEGRPVEVEEVRA